MNSRSSAQSGFTLIELMVASTLGLILLAATGEIFLSNKQSFTVQQAMGTVQENARFAMFFLQRDLRNAGFSTLSRPPPFVYFRAACNALTASLCTTAANTGTLDGGGNASDQIEIQSQSAVDCLGRAVPTIAPALLPYVRNRYFIETDADGISRLKCQSFTLNPNSTPAFQLNGGNFAAAANAGGAQPLVEGIETLQLLYGEDTDGDFIADHYVKAGEVPELFNVPVEPFGTEATWKTRIVSVRVGILASSLTEMEAKNTAQSYLVLDAPVFSRNDRQRRRAFVATVEVRNSTP